MDRDSFSANAEMSAQELSLILPVRKNILELGKDRALRLNFSDAPLDEFCICIEDVCLSEFRKWLLKFFCGWFEIFFFSFFLQKVAIEIFLQLCTAYFTCVNKVSHLCYWSKTINDSCWKEVDGELRVALSNIEPNVQRPSQFSGIIFQSGLTFEKLPYPSLAYDITVIFYLNKSWWCLLRRRNVYSVRS